MSRVERLAAEALAHLPGGDLASRARIHSALSIAYELDGQDERAGKSYEECIRLARESGYRALATHTMMMRAQWRLAYGKLHESARISQAIVDLGGDSVFLPAGQGYIGLAAVHLEWNRLDEAERYLGQGIEMCSQGGLAGVSAGLVLRARLCQARGDFDGALEAGQSAEALYGGSDIGATVRQIMANLAKGDVPEAARLAGPWMSAVTALMAAPGGLHGPSPTDYRLGKPPPLVAEEVLVALARVLVAQGAADKALQLLDLLEASARPGNRNGRLIESGLLRALAVASMMERAPDKGPSRSAPATTASNGAVARAVEVLQQVLELAEPEGYILTFLEAGPSLTPLLEAVSHRPGTPVHVARYAKMLLTTLLAGPISNLASGGTSARAVAANLPEALTPRELEVLQFIAAGDSNQAIADKMFVTLSAVKKHTSSIYSKPGVGSRTQAILRAREAGLLGIG